MKIQGSKFKKSVFLLFAFYFLFSATNSVSAQTAPQFLFSWRARTFAPSWYQGKILPTNKTPVDASFELISNGKPVDLSKTKIRWYVNDTLLKNEVNGLGIKKITFFTPDYAGGSSIVKIVLPEYPSSGEQPAYVAEIPVVSPDVVIDAPYADNKVGLGQSFLRAIPFFFSNSLANLSIEWLVNNRAPNSSDGDPFLLGLNVDPQTAPGELIDISISLKNLLNAMDFASKNINLTVK